MKRTVFVLITLSMMTGCMAEPADHTSAEISSEPVTKYTGLQEDNLITVGKKKDRGMIADNTYHDPERGDIHFSSYVLFVINPGWEGEYQQGIGENPTQPFPFEAEKYNRQMIIFSPQPNGRDEDSAKDSLARTHHFLNHYNINPDQICLHEHSGRGETVSWELNPEPELFTRVFMTSSQFDGNPDASVKAETPLYLAVVRNDAWYTEKPFQNVYEKIHDAYVSEGKAEDEIHRLLVLDIRDSDFGKDYGVNNTHGAEEIFASDQKVMNWLFEKNDQSRREYHSI